MTPNPNLNEIKQPEHGDIVYLLVGDLNPPCLDHKRAIDAILLRPKVSSVWLCPFTGQNDANVRNLCTIFGAEYSANNGKPITCCSVGLDKKLNNPLEIVKWCRKHHPYLKFIIAGMNLKIDNQDKSEHYINIRFSGQGYAAIGKESINLDKYFSVQNGMIDRIIAGLDESSNLTTKVWEYIQKNKVYRS